MAKQDMNELWKLFASGGAHSEGYRGRKPGSARCFAYGVIGGQPGVSITTWDRAPLTVQPATPEAVQAALDGLRYHVLGGHAMKITREEVRLILETLNSAADENAYQSILHSTAELSALADRQRQLAERLDSLLSRPSDFDFILVRS